MLKPFDLATTEVLGQALLTAVFSRPNFVQNNMLKILEQQGIINPTVEEWYPIKSFLHFYDEVLKEYGPNTLFDLGKAVPDSAVFPPGVDSLQAGLDLIGTAYNMNHRNGYFGFYKLVEHLPEKKEVIMQCYNPYPCDFDRGLLTSMARKFKLGVRVVVDESKPCKSKGASESWYIISYR